MQSRVLFDNNNHGSMMEPDPSPTPLIHASRLWGWTYVHIINEFSAIWAIKAKVGRPGSSQRHQYSSRPTHGRYQTKKQQKTGYQNKDYVCIISFCKYLWW